MEQSEKPRHNATSGTSANPLATTIDVRTMIAKIILKSRLACSLPALEVVELKAAVESWAEVIEGAIPAHRLNDCYIYAMRNRTSKFPLESGDIIAAYKSIANNERYRPLGQDRMIIGDVCLRCNGTGVEIIRDEEKKTTSSRPCSH